MVATDRGQREGSAVAARILAASAGATGPAEPCSLSMWRSSRWRPRRGRQAWPGFGKLGRGGVFFLQNLCVSPANPNPDPDPNPNPHTSFSARAGHGSAFPSNACVIQYAVEDSKQLVADGTRDSFRVEERLLPIEVLPLPNGKPLGRSGSTSTRIFDYPPHARGSFWRPGACPARAGACAAGQTGSSARVSVLSAPSRRS